MAESEENSNESLHSIHSDQSEKSDEEFFESRAVEPEQPTVGDGKVGTKAINVDNDSVAGQCNGEVGLYEIAVEAQPDVVFESDLVPTSPNESPFVRPRVYLERELFASQTVDVLQLENASFLAIILFLFVSSNC